MTQDNAIQTKGLTRYFGARCVVRDLDFSVPRGSIVGLLGLNGAGKSTTIRMMLGLLTPTRGTCEILGKDSSSLTPEDRSRIGHTTEGHYLYPWMRVDDCEAFSHATATRWDRNAFRDMIDRFGVEASQKISHLSRGQRAGVSLASTLAASPELLVLDDPALGLDPVNRRALNETILDFCESGERTVLLSSHLLDDVERIADRIAIMVAGKLLVDTSLDHFRANVCSWSVDGKANLSALRPIPGLIHSRRLSGQWIVTIAGTDELTQSTLEQLGLSFEPAASSFEDSIMAYLSRERSVKTFLPEIRTKQGTNL